MPFKANRLEIEVIMLSIISHTLKDEYHVFSDMQNRDFRGKKKSLESRQVTNWEDEGDQ